MATKTQPKLEVVPSKDAKAARLEALDWLREGFNRETGRFSAGVSDATIAQETGLAVAAVAALREEWFGALREPSEIEALRTELEAAQSQIATIVQRLDGLCKANGWAA